MSGPSQPSPGIPVVSSKSITVNISKPTWIRFYVPTAALNGGVSPKKLPLVVYFHGGEFAKLTVNYKAEHDFCEIMARDHNAMVASASYRLAPKHRLPAAYYDGGDALEWIKNSGDEWIKTCADLSNVFLMGRGSGGNVAYNVGIRAANLAPLRIRGLILCEPLFGGEERCESELNMVHPVMLSVSDRHWEICLPVGANRDHEYSNPTVGDGPDIMEVIGQRGWKVLVSGRKVEPLIDRQRNVAKLMKQKGVDVVECFTDRDVLYEVDLFESISILIHSCAP